MLKQGLCRMKGSSLRSPWVDLMNSWIKNYVTVYQTGFSFNTPTAAKKRCNFTQLTS